MPKQVRLFLILFVALAAAAAVVFLKGKPTTKNINPLQNVEAEAIDGVEIEQNKFFIKLTKNNNIWSLIKPVPDLADAQVVERLTAVLHGLIVTTPISEKKERYLEFGLDDEHSINIRAFTKKSDAPSLAIVLGKDTSTFGNTFLRFPDKPSIYIAEGFPTYLIPRSTDSYRLQTVFLAPVAICNRAAFTWGGTTYELQRSSVSWTLTSSGKTIDAAWVQELSSKLATLRPTSFVEVSDLVKPSGLETPLVKIKLEAPGLAEEVVLGQKISAKNNPVINGQHYAQHNERTSVMIVSDTAVKEFFDYLKKIPLQ